MSAYKIQMQGNYPEESTQHSEHSESLKSRILLGLLYPSRWDWQAVLKPW